MDQTDFLKRISFIMQLCNLKPSDVSYLTGVYGTSVNATLSCLKGISDEMILQYIRGLHIRNEWLEEPAYEDTVPDEIFEEGWVIRHSEEEIRTRLKEVLTTGVRELAGINENIQLTIQAAERISMVCGKSAEWILYGIEQQSEYPVDDIVMEYLGADPELRKKIWKESRKLRQRDSLADRLRSLMHYRGSNPIAVSRNTLTDLLLVNRYLKGEVVPDRGWIERFATLYGADPDWLERGGEIRLREMSFSTVFDEARQELKSLRKSLGLSQEQMAKELNIPRTSLCRMETGVFSMSLDLVQKVREVYAPGFLMKR